MTATSAAAVGRHGRGAVGGLFPHSTPVPGRSVPAPHAPYSDPVMLADLIAHRKPFTLTELVRRYRDRNSYLDRRDAAAQVAARAGWLLGADLMDLLHLAGARPMAGKPAWPARCARPTCAPRPWARRVAGERRAGGRPARLVCPRELVAAAGMLPVRLSPRRLARDGAPVDSAAAAGLTRELPPELARVVAALLTGALDWVDALLIGRDSEAHTKLFYVLRELRRSGAAPGLPPVAFFDLLRSCPDQRPLQPAAGAGTGRRPSHQLGGQPVTPASLAVAVSESAATAAALRALAALRTTPLPRVAGGDAVAAASAPPRCCPARSSARSSRPSGSWPKRRRPPLARVFLTGSGQDDLSVYETLEQQGLAVVGEDRGWGDDGSEVPASPTTR